MLTETASTGHVAESKWLVFLALHAPLGMVVMASPLIATAHAAVTLAAAFLLVSSSRAPDRVVYYLGYIAASESLWRASKAMIFFESAKYAVAAISLIALVRFRLVPRAEKTALVYFLLLLPSLLMLPSFDRQKISFNLSGPFALAIGTLFLSTVRIPPRLLASIALVTLAPIVSLASVATFSTLTTEVDNFYVSRVASAGLGNNQASSALGLGGFMAFLYICIERKRPFMSAVVIAIGLWCMAQGALTFSRGGILTTLGAIAAGSLFLLQDRSFRGVVIVRVALIAAIGAFVILPAIDSFTGGALLQRFHSTDLTGRDKIIQADLIAFRENPVFGVGPGESPSYHTLTFHYSAAHTEYSRLLAEHGSFGLLALLLLGWMSLRRITRPRPITAKAFAAAMTVWALLFMFHAAMRMAAASFMFALGSAHLFAPQTGVKVRARSLAGAKRPLYQSRNLPGTLHARPGIRAMSALPGATHRKVSRVARPR